MASTAKASRHCDEPGCIWPEYESGKCLKHLREQEDPLPYMKLEAVSRYSDIGNVNYVNWQNRGDE